MSIANDLAFCDNCGAAVDMESLIDSLGLDLCSECAPE